MIDELKMAFILLKKYSEIKSHQNTAVLTHLCHPWLFHPTAAEWVAATKVGCGQVLRRSF
jgi:hypothetical protein